MIAKVSSGQKLRIPAADYNAFVDAAEAYKSQSRQQQVDRNGVPLPPDVALVRNDSGHGMLFRTFAGQLMLVVHQPFIGARAKLYEMEDLGDNLRVVKYCDDLSGPPLGPQEGQLPQ